MSEALKEEIEEDPEDLFLPIPGLDATLTDILRFAFNFVICMDFLGFSRISMDFLEILRIF